MLAVLQSDSSTKNPHSVSPPQNLLSSLSLFNKDLNQLQEGFVDNCSGISFLNNSDICQEENYSIIVISILLLKY